MCHLDVPNYDVSRCVHHRWMRRYVRSKAVELIPLDLHIDVLGGMESYAFCAKEQHSGRQQANREDV